MQKDAQTIAAVDERRQATGPAARRVTPPVPIRPVRARRHRSAAAGFPTLGPRLARAPLSRSPFGTCVDDLPLQPTLPAEIALSGKAGCEPERCSYWLHLLGPPAELLTDAFVAISMRLVRAK